MTAPKLIASEPLPGHPLASQPPEIRSWVAKRAGNDARVITTGEIVLCAADGVHRTYPTMTAACAAVAL